MITEKDINDYIYRNECFKEDNIVCPYCGFIDSEIDPVTLYSEIDNKKCKCECCGKTFLLTASFDWWYTTTPTEEETKKILEEENECNND